MRTYSNALAERINTILTDDDWRFDFDDENGVFRFGIGGIKQMRNISCQVIVGENFFTIYAICPVNADMEETCRRNEMMEFVCRTNYGLRMGNFELDVTDGEIRFKVHTVSNNGQIVAEDLINPLTCAAAMYDRYAEGFFGIIFKDYTAEEAIRLCE